MKAGTRKTIFFCDSPPTKIVWSNRQKPQHQQINKHTAEKLCPPWKCVAIIFRLCMHARSLFVPLIFTIMTIIMAIFFIRRSFPSKCVLTYMYTVWELQENHTVTHVHTNARSAMWLFVMLMDSGWKMTQNWSDTIKPIKSALPSAAKWAKGRVRPRERIRGLLWIARISDDAAPALAHQRTESKECTVDYYCSMTQWHLIVGGNFWPLFHCS